MFQPAYCRAATSSSNLPTASCHRGPSLPVPPPCCPTTHDLLSSCTYPHRAQHQYSLITPSRPGRAAVQRAPIHPSMPHPSHPNPLPPHCGRWISDPPPPPPPRRPLFRRLWRPWRRRDRAGRCCPRDCVSDDDDNRVNGISEWRKMGLDLSARGMQVPPPPAWKATQHGVIKVLLSAGNGGPALLRCNPPWW
jgi:hypothetical protein